MSHVQNKAKLIPQFLHHEAKQLMNESTTYTIGRPKHAKKEKRGENGWPAGLEILSSSLTRLLYSFNYVSKKISITERSQGSQIPPSLIPSRAYAEEMMLSDDDRQNPTPFDSRCSTQNSLYKNQKSQRNVKLS